MQWIKTEHIIQAFEVVYQLVQEKLIRALIVAHIWCDFLAVDFNSNLEYEIADIILVKIVWQLYFKQRSEIRDEVSVRSLKKIDF